MISLDENTEIFGFDGVIGRRNFIVNYIIIVVIVSIFSMIANFVVIMQSMESYLPHVSLLSRIFFVFLLYPSVERRVLDISENKDKGIIFYINLALIIMMLCLFPVFNIFIILMLFLYRGNSQRPKNHSDIVKFNWGAFLGTWIWGIWNKAPKTLLMIPLFFTPAGLPFALICGIKGNEWAYKNGQDEESFHHRQENQTVFWAIAAPVFFVLTILILIFSSGIVISKYEKLNPGFVETKVEKFVDYSINTISDIKFSKIEKVEDEYKFYISPKEWNMLSGKSKVSLFLIALSKSVILENKNILKSDLTIKRISKVKIYSDFNNELLARFVVKSGVDPDLIPDNLEKTLQNNLEFNSYPTLP